MVIWRANLQYQRIYSDILSAYFNIHTEKSYIRWIVRFIRYHKMAHPGTLGEAAVNAFLTDLALKNVAPNTQAQALNALVFLYKEVIGRELERIDFTRTKRSPKIPVFLERFEVTAIYCSI